MSDDVSKARGSAPGPRWGLRPQTPICLITFKRGAWRLTTKRQPQPLRLVVQNRTPQTAGPGTS
jgi:hypothetical protein